MLTSSDVRKLVPKFRANFPDFNKYIEWNNTILREWEYELLKSIGAVRFNACTDNYAPYMQMLIEDAKQLGKENTFKRNNPEKSYEQTGNINF